MSPTHHLLTLVLSLNLVGAAPPLDSADDAGKPRVAVQLAAGPYHVGQGVSVIVVAPEGDLQAPTLRDAELIKLETLTSGQSSFVLIPRRAGPLTVGSFRVQRSGRSVGSKPVVVPVGKIPLEERPAAFLGGVGDFALEARLAPATVRVGQTLELEIALRGPAAWGSAPSLALTGLPPGLQLREASSHLTPGGTPCRTFTYRLRALAAGPLIIPPLPVAAFDPATGRFRTRFSRSQAANVAALGSFDPARVDFGPRRATDRSGRRKWVALILGVVGVGISAGLFSKRRNIRAWMRAYRDRRPLNWERESWLFMRWVEANPGDTAALAQAVVTRLAHALDRATGTTSAVLTPIEAEAAVESLTQSPELAQRTGALISRCDQLRFDRETHATVGDREELVAEAVAVFQAIGRCPAKNEFRIRNKRQSALLISEHKR